MPDTKRPTREVTVVRPYSPRIRTRMIDHLRRAGLVIPEGHVVPIGATDDEAVRATIELGDAILLVPFHARRDARGEIADGITFLRALARALSSLPHRVLMPVSRFGAAGLELALASSDLPLERVLIITEDELDDRSLAARIRLHVERRESVLPQRL